MKASLDGTRVVALAQTTLAWSLAVDSTNAYWVAQGRDIALSSFWAVPIAGGTPTEVPLGPIQRQAVVLAVDVTGVYVGGTDGFSGSSLSWDVMRLPAGGGPAALLTSEAEFILQSVLAVAAGNVYWRDMNDDLMTAPITGGMPAIAATNFFVTTLAADSAGVYGTTGCGNYMDGGDICTGAVLGLPLP
jgi:hypothetical protein